MIIGNKKKTENRSKNAVHPVILSDELKKQTQSLRPLRPQRLMKNKVKNVQKFTKSTKTVSKFVFRIFYPVFLRGILEVIRKNKPNLLFTAENAEDAEEKSMVHGKSKKYNLRGPGELGGK